MKGLLIIYEKKNTFKTATNKKKKKKTDGYFNPPDAHEYSGVPPNQINATLSVRVKKT